MIFSFLIGLNESLYGVCVLLSNFKRILFAILDGEEHLHPKLMNPKLLLFELSLQ